MPTRIVWGASAAYAVIFFLLGADRYATYHAGADLGIFAQAVAGAAAGMHDTYEGASHFAFHFSPILYLCAPLVLLAHSALALTAISAIATALTAPAVYAIARRRTSDANAAVLACVTLIYPPLQGVTFTDFHEVAFAPAAIAWLLWAIDARRWGTAAVLLALVLAIKEDLAAGTFFLGVAGSVYFAQKRERSAALFCAGTAVASCCALALYLFLIRPLAGSAHGWVPEHFYTWGDGPPVAFGQQFAGRITYLLEAFVPLAFLPFRSRAILLAVPGFVEVLASSDSIAYTMGQHYAAVWIPYVLVAYAIAGARLLERGKKAWVRASAALCIVVAIAFSPLHLGHYLRARDAADAAADAAIARLPQSASIGTTDEIYAHLGFFPNARVGLRGAPDYVLFDSAYSSTFWDDDVLPQIALRLATGVYRVEAVRDGVVLLRRTSATPL